MTLQDHSQKMEVIDSKELSKTIRKTNYNLGSDKLDYKSEASNRFVHHRDVENAELNAETKKDLRSHHFRLGYNNYFRKTEYKG